MLAFFCLGARYRPWRYFAALHSRVFGDGAMHRAVPAARSSRASTLSFVLLAGAFSKSCLRRRFYAGRAAVIWCGANPSVRPWQVLRSMHPESGLGRENRQFAARFARHASENGLALARYARHASEMPRKQPFGNTPRGDLARKGPFSLHGPLESRMARESCHPASTKRPSARNPCAADQRQTARAPATPAPPNSASRQS